MTDHLPDAVRALLASAEAQASDADGPDAGDNGAFPPGAPRRRRRSGPDRELTEACAREPETDIGNARRLMRRYGDRILYVAHVGWHLFDGCRWDVDADRGIVMPLAHASAEAIPDEVEFLSATPDEKQLIDQLTDLKRRSARLGRKKADWTPDQVREREALDERLAECEAALHAVNGRVKSRLGHAKSAANAGKLKAMVDVAMPYVARPIADLNTDLYALNTAGGTLRFIQMEDPESEPSDPRYLWSVRQDPPRPGDLITKLAPTPYIPGQSAPGWERFLRTIQPDPEIRAFLRRLFGYAILGRIDEQIIVWFWGAGNNGKSTLMDVLRHVLGDYMITLAIESFTGDVKRAGGAPTPDLARLPGVRIVSTSEPEDGITLKESLIKRLTGDATIEARHLQKDFFDVILQAVIFVCANPKPVIRDTSDGMWRRLLMVKFPVQIPDAEVDRALGHKLKAEAPGILAWLVAGALEYLECGLMIPDQVRADVTEHREASDAVGAFLRNGCVVTGEPTDEETPKDLYEAYVLFQQSEGTQPYQIQTFLRRLTDAQTRSWPSPDGTLRQFTKVKASRITYRGIRIRAEYRPSTVPKGGWPD